MGASQDTDDRIRVAWLSFWQAHSAPAPELAFPGPGTVMKAIDHPQLDVVAAWDDDERRGRDRCARIGLRFVPDLEELLASQDIDGVLVSAPTTQHRAIIGSAAAAGKHVHSAKVLAPTLAEARAIVATADTAGVALVTDMGWLSSTYVMRIRELLDAGAIGDLVSVRISHFHSMASCLCGVDHMGHYPDGHGFLRAAEGAGGALVDMCHPTYVTPFLCGGLPDSIYARFGSATKRGDVEDNAAVIFDYRGGPYALIETSWATPPMTTEIDANGTRGTIRYRSVRGISSSESFTMRVGDEPEFRAIEHGAPPPTTLDIWVDHIRRGARPDTNIAQALDLALLNEAAYRSAAAGVPVALADIDG